MRPDGSGQSCCFADDRVPSVPMTGVSDRMPAAPTSGVASRNGRFFTDFARPLGRRTAMIGLRRRGFAVEGESGIIEEIHPT
jgi:hypothetical protein